LAEEVEIGNVGGTGVASEATLARLTASIEAMARKAGIDPKAEAAKLQKLHNTAVKSGITTFDNSQKAQKANTKAVGEATQATNQFARRLGGAMLGAIGTAVGAIKGLGNEILQGGESFGEITKHIPLFGSTLAPLAGLIDNSVESFRQLSTVGGAIGNDITKVRRAAADMELNMDEYTQLIISNGEALRALGGDVQTGQMRFAAMNKNLKASGSFAELKNLGFTIMDLNEGMADYITLQRNSGRLEGRSTESLAKGSADYLKQIDLLARATGKSRKEVEASLQAQAVDAGIRGLLDAFRDAEGNLSQEGLNLQASLALIDQYAGESGTAFKELMMGLPQSDVTAEFLAGLGSAGPKIQEALMKVGEGADPQILIDAMANAGGALEEFAKFDTGNRVQDAKDRAIFITGLRKTNPALADFLDMSTKLTAAKTVNIDDIKKQQQISNDSTKSMLTFDDAIKSIRGVIQTALLDSGLFEALGDAMGGLSDVFGDAEFKKRIEELAQAFASKTKEFINLFKEGGFKAVFNEAISGLGGILGDAFVSAITNPKVILGIAGAFAALFALKAVSGAFTSGISSLFGGGGGGKTGGGGTKGGTGGAKVGKNVGGFVGGLGEGVMKGAAAGLKAFAHPMVPVGAAALGAAIVAIGAGIAGASWILGKALPTFVDGLKSFEDLDGEALGSAALGMTKLSGAMAAFGAGTAVAGLGTLVGGITEGIGKLFGAEDPLEKVKRFAAAKIDGERVKTNAEALIAFSSAMAASGGANAATGLGTLVGGIAGGIGKLFGGDTDPLTNLKKFGDTSVNSAQVKSNAEAMVSYADAMSAVAPGATAGLGELVGNIAGGIGKLFGLEASDPTKDLEKFGNLTIDSAKVKTNAEAMVAFGTAMSSLPTTMPGDGAFTTFGKAIAGFFGAETPFEQLQSFGQLQFDAEKVKTNSEALVAFGTALASMPSDDLGTLKLDKSFVTNLKNLSLVDGQGLAAVQTSLANIVGTPNLTTTLTDLNELGKNYKNVEDLAEAMEDLADAMKEVNEQSKNTSRGRNAGRGNNESSSASASIVAASGTGSGNDKLNSIMQEVSAKLDQLGYLETISKNTKTTGSNVLNLAERL
tara:strand:- start:899 stop:4210 length:3312 start_codon:yes stop_codon:yes gene_type:complete